MGNVAKARGVGALLGVMAGIGPRIALAERNDLPITKTGCGHAVELRLEGTPERRFLVVLDSNESSTPSRLDTSSVLVRIGGGPALRLRNVSGDAEATPGGSWAAYSLALPGDVTFSDATVSVVLPFESADGECTLDVERRLRPYLPVHLPRPAYSVVEINAGGEFVFAATQNQQQLGATGHGGFHLGLGGYPWLHHGIFLDITLDGYGSRGVSEVFPRDPTDGKLSLAAIGFLPTYAFRVYPAPWLAVSYWASFSPLIFEVSDQDTERRRHLATAVFSLRERLRVAAPFFLAGPRGTSFSLGASVVHTLVPYGSLGHAPLAGSTVGVLAELVVDGVNVF